jgi:DNA-binding CsgD family transcriptional regulator
MVEASTTQPRRAARRIIERPRLIKLLDESEARVLLLLAPAGYGKTTLARQWARTLNRAVWVTLTPAHKDVAVLAESVATSIDSPSGDVSSFVREYVAAQASPQRAHRGMAHGLARRLKEAAARWIFFDDYHELLGSPEAEEFVSLLVDGTSARIVIASRQRPTWANSRRVVYGELDEIGRDLLAMNDEESTELLGRGAGRLALARQAEGWPAVLSLASAVEHASPPTEAVPSALHRYFAEELFQRVPSQFREWLVDLALLPSLSDAPVEPEAQTAIEVGAEVGFISGDEHPELHPLLREFLFEKLLERPDCDQRIHDAIYRCVEVGAWDGAIALLRRFRPDELVEPVLAQAFKPLAFSGRLETLSSLAAVFRVAPSFPPPSIDVIEAESALRDGNYELAAQLAARVRAGLPEHHPLMSRASAIDGHSNVQLARFSAAEQAFAASLDAAEDDVDLTEALHGLAVARTLGEVGELDEVVSALWRRRHLSPTHLLRASTTEISRRRLEEGLADQLELEEPLMACAHVQDPRARTSFNYGAAYALAQQARYQNASNLLRRVWADIEEFDLEFVRPHAVWATALVQLGLRRFGQVERLLQTLEDAAAERADARHALNARSLRARLLLQTGKHSDAVALTEWTSPDAMYPSWEAEYLATRAIALASIGDIDAATRVAARASSTSRMVEVRGLVAAARSIIAVTEGDSDSVDLVLWQGVNLGVWDAVVCAVRSSALLADAVATRPAWKDRLERLYEESNDRGLARRAGFRTRSTRSPEELLTPREMEVLNLIARGMRTLEIARALFISPSTTKVHVRHILEKLGVRTRAEAVARLEMFR